MASKRKVSNPLALAVMALLFERPMHPYEIVSLMRERRKHESVRFRYSSLYSVVAALQREGLVEPMETVREGRRPGRTVYGISAAGREEFRAWLRELLREPAKEYPRFMAGLSFIAGLPPDEASGLLEERAGLLEDELGKARSRLGDALEQWELPRLFVVEHEYELMLKEVELRWVRDIVGEMRDGKLGSLAEWRSFHAEPAAAGKEEAGG